MKANVNDKKIKKIENLIFLILIGDVYCCILFSHYEKLCTV